MLTKILFLGDVMAGENLFHLGRGILSKFKNKYQQIIAFDTKNLFDVDFIFYNFEYSLNQKLSNNNLGVLDKIYTANIDSLNIFPDEIPKIVNVANNHFAQHGKTQTDFTLNELKKRNNFITGFNNKPVELKHKDHSIKFWGVSLIQDNSNNNLYFLSKYKNLLSDLNLPKKQADETWIISIHWGEEYCSKPSKYQNKLAQELIDNGFDIIVGHHPHVIQPVQFYKNKPIYYSLGNFIFDQNFSKKTRKGLAIKSSISSENTVSSDYYYTYQKKHIVSKLESVQKNSLSLIHDSCSKTKIKYKLLMKFEYLLNVFKTDSAVFSYLIKKQFLRK